MRAARWIVDNAPGFKALTRIERSAVRDFSLLWSVVEGRHVAEAEANFTRICDAARDAMGAQAQGPGSFVAELRYFQDRYGAAHMGTQRLDALMNGRTPAMRTYIETVLAEQRTSTHEIAAGLLLIAFRLRNNLFHGTKWNNEMVDQLRNFRAAGTVLMKVMDRRPHRHQLP